MEWLRTTLNTTWKRVVAALLLSAAIILAINTLAESTLVQTQKVQQESARGQHCQQWTYGSGSGSTVTCVKWQEPRLP